MNASESKPFTDKSHPLAIALTNGSVVITEDGRVETTGEYAPDEAARVFWKAMADGYAGWFRPIIERRLEAEGWRPPTAGLRGRFRVGEKLSPADELMSKPVVCPHCGFEGTISGPYHDCKGGRCTCAKGGPFEYHGAAPTGEAARLAGDLENLLHVGEDEQCRCAACNSLRAAARLLRGERGTTETS